MSDPFIIMSAPNGARRQKADHSAIPLTPKELADCAAEVADAGASILHLHVRDDRGRHSLDPDRYRAAIAAIRDAAGEDIIIQATSEAVGQYSTAQQMAMVKDLRPEAVSLALRELCPDEAALAEFAAFVRWMENAHIFPQYILYDVADYQRFETYRRQGVFQNDRPFILAVLGDYHGRTVPGDIDRMKQVTAHGDFPWAVCGFGPQEGEAAAFAARNKGHIRVGFENNIWATAGQKLPGHGDMIRYCTDAAQRAKRLVATADDVRNLFELKKG